MYRRARGNPGPFLFWDELLRLLWKNNSRFLCSPPKGKRSRPSRNDRLTAAGLECSGPQLIC
jgi:hypothetical protein